MWCVLLLTTSTSSSHQLPPSTPTSTPCSWPSSGTRMLTCRQQQGCRRRLDLTESGHAQVRYCHLPRWLSVKRAQDFAQPSEKHNQRMTQQPPGRVAGRLTSSTEPSWNRRLGGGGGGGLPTKVVPAAVVPAVPVPAFPACCGTAGGEPAAGAAGDCGGSAAAASDRAEPQSAPTSESGPTSCTARHGTARHSVLTTAQATGQARHARAAARCRR